MHDAPTDIDAPQPPTAESRSATTPRKLPIRQWSALLALFVLTLEMTARIEDWIRFRTPLLSPIVDAEQLIVRDEHGMHGRPNARFQRWSINHLGMRGPDVPARKTVGTVRIVAAGASETFGLHESREYPRQLEDTLNVWLARGQCRNASVQRFEVLNAALPGMSLPTVEQDVRLRVRHLDPDIVVVYPTPVQYLMDDPPIATPPDSAAHPSTAATIGGMLYPRVAARIKHQAGQAVPSFIKAWLKIRRAEAVVAEEPREWRFTTVPADRLGRYDSDLRSLISTIRSNGATPIVGTHANAFMRAGFENPDWLSSWGLFYPRALAPVIPAFDSAARPVTLQAAHDSSVIAVDLADRLARAPGDFFTDYSHFSDLGAAHVAAALGPAVLQVMRQRGVCQ